MSKFVIATRGSALALWQAEHVRARLQVVQPGVQVELLVLTTQGDKILDVPLAKVGGKGLFVKEIEQALIDGAADIAVHSMKDVPAQLEPGLLMAAVSAGEVPWDALCMRASTWTTLDQLPHGAHVGTSSMRRQCQLLARRPDLRIGMLRGNVPTRVGRLDAGGFDAIVLAAAGLTRLGLGARITQALTPDVCLPAVAQGVLGIETRADDDRAITIVRAAMHDDATAERVAAERGFQVRMGGSCETPLAAHASRAADGSLIVDGLCGMPDGSRILRARVTGPAADAAALGRAVADELLANGAEAMLAAGRAMHS